MDFFKNKENVDKYIEMVKDYDGTWLINKIDDYLEKECSLLELGMGPGTDLQILSRKYKVVGSDNSSIFIEKFNKKNTGIEAIYIDAKEMNTDRKFDCIYSNKVLHHLKKSEFIESIKNQNKNLNQGGIIFMTLWRGEYREEIMFDGEVRFTYYLESDIKEIVEKDYNILCLETYNECDKNDSLLVVLRKK